MENVREKLILEAERLGACRKGLRNLPLTIPGIVQRWKENIDFALEKDFPSVDFIKENFDAKLLRDNLVYVDEHLNIEDAPNGVYMLNGNCTGTIHFRQWAAATVYVRHTSEITVIAEDFAKVFIRLYDDADANVVDLGDARVKVYDRR